MRRQSLFVGVFSPCFVANESVSTRRNMLRFMHDVCLTCLLCASKDCNSDCNSDYNSSWARFHAHSEGSGNKVDKRDFIREATYFCSWRLSDMSLLRVKVMHIWISPIVVGQTSRTKYSPIYASRLTHKRRRLGRVYRRWDLQKEEACNYRLNPTIKSSSARP